MKEQANAAVMDPPTQTENLRFQVTDVTGTKEMEVEVASATPTGQVAKHIAERLQLPTNVPWALRDDRGGFLDDARQIGEQVADGSGVGALQSRISIVPKTHLG